MAFTQQQLTQIPHILSGPRFARYLQHRSNNRESALILYKWNLDISGAFSAPLHLLEISTRNAVVEVLEQVHTSNWPWNNGFIRSLPNPSNPRAYSPQIDLNRTAQNHPTMGQVVANLKFVFWEKMFTSRHDYRLWNNHIKQVFPYAPSSLTEQQIRQKINDTIFNLRQLRNRIAHHEPIFNRNLSDDYSDLIQLVNWRDQVTADWLNSFEDVTNLLANKP